MPAGRPVQYCDTAWQYCLGSPSGHRPSSPRHREYEARMGGERVHDQCALTATAGVERANAGCWRRSRALSKAAGISWRSEWDALSRAEPRQYCPGSIGSIAMVRGGQCSPRALRRTDAPARGAPANADYFNSSHNAAMARIPLK